MNILIKVQVIESIRSFLFAYHCSLAETVGCPSVENVRKIKIDCFVIYMYKSKNVCVYIYIY